MPVIDFNAARKRIEALAGEVSYEFTPKITVGDILNKLDAEIGTRAIVQELL